MPEEEPVEEEDDGPTPHSDDDDDDGLREKPGFRLASDPSIHWRSGSKVSALDKCNVWCDAVVTDERGQGSSRQLRVHYSGWNKRFDEWLFVSGGRLRAPPSGAPRPLPSPRAPRHSRTAQPRRAPPLITAVAIAIPASLSFGGAAPRHARPPAARALTRFSTARAVRDDTVSPAPSLPAPPAPPAPRPAAASAAPPPAPPAPPVPGLLRQVSLKLSGAGPAAEAAAAAEASAEAAFAHAAAGAARFGAEHRRARRLHAGGEAARFDRCGTFGCILADRHPGLHIFEQAAKRQRPAKKEPVEEEAADPRPNHHAGGISRERSRRGRGRGREA